MNRLGFTLVELLVTLTISGLVLLVGGASLGALLSASRDIAAAGVTEMRAANRARWLRRTVASLEVGLPGDVPFEGQPDRVRFSSFTLTSHGWSERKPVELASIGNRLVALVGAEVGVVLADSLAEARFDYLILPGLESRWTHRWQSPTSAPIALRLRLSWLDTEQKPDTLLLLVGERG